MSGDVPVEGAAKGGPAEWGFATRVAEGGYRWVRYEDLGPDTGTPLVSVGREWERAGGWVLTERDTSASRTYREVRPFRDCPTMFREFASLAGGDRDVVLEFASRYGMLGLRTGLHQLVEPPAGGAGRWADRNVACDPERYWQYEPAKLCLLVRLWSALTDGDVRELRRLLRWQETVTGWTWVCCPDPAIDKLPEGWVDEVRDPSDVNTPLWKGTESVQRIAEAYLAHNVTDGLWRADSQRLMFTYTPEGQPAKFDFQVMSENLLGALYVQFGRSVIGKKSQSSCKACGTWFQLVPQDKGRKEFCSPACKAAEYRGRKKRAMELSAEGQTLDQIAEATRTERTTVKKWVRTKGRKKRKGE